MKHEDSLILNLIALWLELPERPRRALRVVAAVVVATTFSLFIAWGIGAFVTWKASPGNWSMEARVSATLIWFGCQFGATVAAVAVAWDA